MKLQFYVLCHLDLICSAHIKTSCCLVSRSSVWCKVTSCMYIIKCIYIQRVAYNFSSFFCHCEWCSFFFLHKAKWRPYAGLRIDQEQELSICTRRSHKIIRHEKRTIGTSYIVKWKSTNLAFEFFEGGWLADIDCTAGIAGYWGGRQQHREASGPMLESSKQGSLEWQKRDLEWGKGAHYVQATPYIPDIKM